MATPKFETLGGSSYLTLNWQKQLSIGDLHHFVAYRVPEPSDATSLKSFYSRLFSHLVLDELPDDALPEVLEFLANSWTFHDRPPVQPVAPQGSKTLKAKLTKRYDRPVYSLPDEE